MPLNIKSPKADRLARELARATGESLTEAVTQALEERLLRETGRGDRDALLRDIGRIRDEYQALPVIDARCPDEIIGYDEHGLPR
ncbi:type II toxin-antitoxin system antitoxin VapB30 [soil metagenome]